MHVLDLVVAFAAGLLVGLLVGMIRRGGTDIDTLTRDVKPPDRKEDPP